MTLTQLMECWGTSAARAGALVDALNEGFAQYEINTPVRAAAFLAQVGHESGRGRYLKELWGPTEAQKRYEGREDLGNTETGDGFRFRGRGLIQVTGRANYRRVGAALGVDLEAQPELLEQPYLAALSAAQWWSANGCNALADAGDFRLLTRRINGGYNGLADRMELWERCKKILYS